MHMCVFVYACAYVCMLTWAYRLGAVPTIDASIGSASTYHLYSHTALFVNVRCLELTLLVHHTSHITHHTSHITHHSRLERAAESFMAGYPL